MFLQLANVCILSFSKSSLRFPFLLALWLNCVSTCILLYVMVFFLNLLWYEGICDIYQAIVLIMLYVPRHWLMKWMNWILARINIFPLFYFSKIFQTFWAIGYLNFTLDRLISYRTFSNLKESSGYMIQLDRRARFP